MNKILIITAVGILGFWLAYLIYTALMQPSTTPVAIVANSKKENTNEIQWDPTNSPKIVDQTRYTQEKNKLQSYVSIVRTTPVSTDTMATKKEAITSLRSMLYDEQLYPAIRASAGEVLIDTFFNVGMQLGEPIFGSGTFTEDDIFALAKYTYSVHPTQKLALLIPYIGLRFYPNSMSWESVLNSIKIYTQVAGTTKDMSPCGNMSKLWSIVYLAQKNGIDLWEEYSDFNIFFSTWIVKCQEKNKSLVAFMWLAAISDTPATDININKSKELLALIIKNKSDIDALTINLRQSYFVAKKEPDTESIVDRLTQQYPEFASYIASYSL